MRNSSEIQLEIGKHIFQQLHLESALEIYQKIRI